MLLAIDTSTSAASVALVRDGRLAAELTWDVGRRHSEELMDRLTTVLTLAGAAPHDLTCVAVAAGPGSFNGVRVAMTAAKTLAFSLGLPLAAFSTLDVTAFGQEASCGTICAVLEAGRGELYTAQYRRGDEVPQSQAERVAGSLWRLTPARIERPDHLAASLRTMASPVLICGEWHEATRDVLSKGSDGRLTFAHPLAMRRAAGLAALAAEAPASAWTREAATIEPLYLRRPAITMSTKQPGHHPERTLPEAGDPRGGGSDEEGDARALRG